MDIVGQPTVTHFIMRNITPTGVYCSRLVITNLHSIITWVGPKVSKTQYIQNIT